YSATAPTASYTLSLHDALPICRDLHHGTRGLRRDGVVLAHLHRRLRRTYERDSQSRLLQDAQRRNVARVLDRKRRPRRRDCHPRSEEHTSELQSLAYLVCRLLL